MRLGFRFRFSGASGITSGSVSSLVDGTRLRFLWRGITQPSPAVSSAYLPKAQSRCDVSNSRPSHYAAVPLIASMERGGKVKFNPEDLVSQATAARMRGVSKQAITGLIQRGKLTTVVIDDHVFLLKREVENFKPDMPGPRPKQATKKRTRQRKSN